MDLVRNELPDVSTLAIGDGANDVSMINAAHVGNKKFVFLKEKFKRMYLLFLNSQKALAFEVRKVLKLSVLVTTLCLNSGTSVA